jgi:predicted nucleotidyltransferase
VENLAPNELAALRKLKESLARDFRLVELRLFGSSARGDSDKESDIDVLVVLEDYDWDTKMAVVDLCTDISIDSGVLLAPVIYSATEFGSDLTKATPFYQAVMKEGVPV